MPNTTVTIDRDQRDGLYELVRNHLGSIEDFWVALERTKDFAAAERMGLEFGEDFLDRLDRHPQAIVNHLAMPRRHRGRASGGRQSLDTGAGG